MELQELLANERPKVTALVSAAAALGDRSENADYIYGKRRLREIDRRIRFLTGRLDNVDITDPLTVDTSKVVFGAWVELADEDGAKHWYQIVGPDEIDPSRGRITFTSPLGRALLGKRAGDVVAFARPKGTTEMEILGIHRHRKPCGSN